MLIIDDLIYQRNNDSDEYNYALEAKEKEINAIVGKSGSGKSTLFDLIAGFLPAKSGSIEFENNDLTYLTIEKRPISILFQHNNLFEHLSVEKNILLGLKKNSKDALNIVGNILKEVGLEGFNKKLASQLSGGEQQRVALARILIRKEPILLLDEPFSGLDMDTKIKILQLVKEITIKYSLHTIMITHDLYDCEKIANNTYEMKNNKLTKQ